MPCIDIAKGVAIHKGRLNVALQASNLSRDDIDPQLTVEGAVQHYNVTAIPSPVIHASGARPRNAALPTDPRNFTSQY